ncbi:MAG: ATP-binding protein [Chloroflexota bacterium]
MISFIRSHLGVKLFISYLVIILAVAFILVTATRFTVPEAFTRHMGGGLNSGTGMMQGTGVGRIAIADLFANFQASFNEALVLALVIAGSAAMLVSLLLSRGIVAPVRRMTTVSQHIADGHYSERVETDNHDELGQLAHSFNQMAENLEQVELMRRQLIADVSHELRTPLTAIQGSMEGLLDGILPAIPETYLQIHQEAGRLARLVDDLQELSRVEAGASPLEIRLVQVNNLIQTTIKRLTPQAIKKKISIVADLLADLPLVPLDEARITQVLTNLVSNALQYTQEGGRIHIGTRQTKDEIQVSITDTGIGIPADHMAHLFTRFYRVDKSRSRQAGGGSGIGLTIARHLVESHGGRIWVESPGEGQGSTFTFSLPLSI